MFHDGKQIGPLCPCAQTRSRRGSTFGLNEICSKIKVEELGDANSNRNNRNEEAS